MSPLDLNPVLQVLVGLNHANRITLQRMYKSLKPVMEALWDKNVQEMIYTSDGINWKCVLVPEQLRPNRFMWNTFLDFRFEVTPVTVDNELDGQAGGAGVSDDPPPRLPTIRTIRDILDLSDITPAQLSSARQRVLSMQKLSDQVALDGAEAAIVASLGTEEAAVGRTEELRLARVALSARAENTIAAQEAADEDDQMEALTLLGNEARRRQAPAAARKAPEALAALRGYLEGGSGAQAIVRAGVAGPSKAGPSRAPGEVCRCTCLAFYGMCIFGA